MTPLLAHLLARIDAEGPLSLETYMAEVLAHPEYGYYMTGDPLGRSGDFVTAPEVSQMFGELIGLWCAVTWSAMGSPARVNLVELGPGRGTLMADALRAVDGVDGFLAALHVHMIETSPSLALRQRRNLSLVTPPVAWHASFAEMLDESQDIPTIVVANEFLDALPIRHYVKTIGGWAERCIGAADGRLVWTDAPLDVPPEGIPAVVVAPGGIVEVSPIRDRVVSQIATRVVRSGGAALFVDYGHGISAAGDTLQAIRNHQYHEVLADPGEADVTSHVDFGAVARAARATGAAVHGPVSQGAFLKALGIEPRASILARGKTPREIGEVLGALNRLTGPREMGELFKVMAVTPPDVPRPEGFGG